MKIKNILTLGLIALLFGSCADKLDVSDPDSLSPESVLDEVGGFESVLLSAYNRLISFTNGYGQNSFIAPEVMADQLDFSNRTGRYETQYVNAVRAHMGRWGRYIGINDANIIISKIDRLREDPTADVDMIDLFKGEALFIRALHYHDLAKVYGYEPGQIMASYDVFMQHIHPDDREKIRGVHQHAYATGEPYQMVERILRPDGELRYLASNGQVVTDANGTPLRMRGTCIDITDRVRAEQAQEETAVRLSQELQARRQAAELNDNVVQGLTAASYAAELGDLERTKAYVAETLAKASKMLDDLMLAGGDPDLTRQDAARLGDTT